jgi:HSP20 family protein
MKTSFTCTILIFVLFLIFTIDAAETKQTTVELIPLKSKNQNSKEIPQLKEKILIQNLNGQLDSQKRENLIETEKNLLPETKKQEIDSNEIHDEQTIDNFWGSWGMDSFNEDEEMTRKYNPESNIYESEDHFVILTELPGIERKDLKIKYEKGDHDFLIISGMKNERNYGNALHEEIDFGEFEQRFKLKHIIDIKAKFENGILKIVLQRKPKEIPKVIDVKIE